MLRKNVSYNDFMSNSAFLNCLAITDLKVLALIWIDIHANIIYYL